MRNFSDKICRGNQSTHFEFHNFFPPKILVYEMRKKYLAPGRPHIAIWCMRIECWISKSTNTHSQYVTQIFHHNNGCTNPSQCYVIRTLPVLLSNSFTQHVGTLATALSASLAVASKSVFRLPVTQLRKYSQTSVHELNSFLKVVRKPKCS